MSSNSEEEVYYTVYEIRSNWFEEDEDRNNFNGRLCFSESYDRFFRKSKFIPVGFVGNKIDLTVLFRYEIPKEALKIIGQEVSYDMALNECIGN